ncbi:PMS1-like protein [Histomonas meleagridis]|uniref:PMS1-like protein n=1 Tax=Histomonas meleagridis TaxID=135588 RepID=UPI0035594978|nr:PMS1-like protein [Histomonas meleagridis]KAH0800156.1 PMS1-like protein [Histomonas meleagridis]
MQKNDSQLVRATETIASPSHVLRELIENSLDAQSKIINIQISGTGLEFITVSDNGLGIDRESMDILCLEGATSKEFGKDYNSGGRGKALDAISSLSYVTIESSSNDDGYGYRLSFSESGERIIQPISRTRGTTIIVQSLFYNYPVRRRFWLEHKQKLSQEIQEVSILFAVSSDIRISLTLDSKPILQLSNRTRFQKIKDVLGQSISNGLIEGSSPLHLWNDDSSIDYYTSTPTTPSNGKVNIFVNGRPCVNLPIIKALKQEFRLCAGPKNPSIFLFINADRSLYDFTPDSPLIGVTFSNEMILQKCLCEIFRNVWKSTSETLTFKDLKSKPIETIPKPPTPLKSTSQNISGATTTTNITTEQICSQFLQMRDYSPAGYPPTPEINTTAFRDMEIIGQWNKSFIITKIGNDIFAIDQHAANEAANFEKLRKQKTNDRQVLLEPIFVPLTPDDLENAFTHQKQCNQFGFDYNILDNGIEVKSVPMDKNVVNGIEDLQELIGLINDVPYSTPMTFNARSQLAYHACHSSVRVGDALSHRQMRKLLEKMASSDYPWNCPHGRPTWCLIYSLSERE